MKFWINSFWHLKSVCFKFKCLKQLCMIFLAISCAFDFWGLISDSTENRIIYRLCTSSIPRARIPSKAVPRAKHFRSIDNLNGIRARSSAQPQRRTFSPATIQTPITRPCAYNVRTRAPTDGAHLVFIGYSARVGGVCRMVVCAQHAEFRVE